ncbi:MAG: phage integrase SAM-like domain-containing protein [Chitinophagaceae bacterium]|nr:phage integrase SAM-like domain-containing protein [Chitinophagaceae bacterium]MCW5928450.1 phage integrase SAM-like domain-containing protein [Chitinophagaceae bacterium]
MAKDKTTIRFWLRSDRKNLDTSCPIHLVYQVKGVRRYYQCPDIHILESNWNVKDQQVVYTRKQDAKKMYPDDDTSLLLAAKDVEPINDKLAELRSLIKDIEGNLRFEKTPITSQLVIERLKEMKSDTTKKEDPGINIADFILRYAKDCSSTHKYRTIQVYEGLATHLKNYEKKYKIAVNFDNINVQLLRGFVNYLLEPKEMSLKPYPSGKPRKPRKVKGMNNITIAKQISTLKTLLKIARTIYKINVNPDYQDFKVARKDSNFEVLTLTNEEFLTLFNFDLSDNKKLEKVRDVFCFSCATGLRYSDLAQLKREHIQHNTIRMTAAKTGQRLDIPLNPYSLAILEKYKDLHAPLPVISGQKTNKYLKELGELAGIDAPVEKVREYGISKKAIPFKKYELMSIHMGRRTFTTLSLEKGMAPQEVMALTGHTTFKAFKRYVDVTNERKKTVMAKAWGEVNDNKLKVV